MNKSVAGPDRDNSQLCGVGTAAICDRYCRERSSVGGKTAAQNHWVWLPMRIDIKKTIVACCHICNMSS